MDSVIQKHSNSTLYRGRRPYAARFMNCSITVDVATIMTANIRLERQARLLARPLRSATGGSAHRLPPEQQDAMVLAQ